MPWLAVLLVLAADVLFAIGAVAQQQEASRLVGSGVSFVRRLLARPRWWAATFSGGVGYLLQAAGLALGSILVVQPLLILALVFALPLSSRWNARPVRGTDIAWAGAIAVALAVFLAVGHPDGGRDTNPFSHWIPSLVGCGTVCVVGAALSLGRSVRLRSLGLAMIAGTLFGLASALTKSLMHLAGEGLDVALTSWETYAVIGSGVLGFVCQQLAFQAGSLEISFPAATVLDPVVSVGVGIAALDERIRAAGPDWILIAVSAAVMVSGTIALARAGAPTSVPTQATSDTPTGPAGCSSDPPPTATGTSRDRPNGRLTKPSAPA